MYKEAPTGCGSREGQGYTVRKHPSVLVKHSRCCNLKKIQKQQQINSWGKAEAGDQFLNLLIFSINIGQVVPGAASPPSCVQPAHLKLKKKEKKKKKRKTFCLGPTNSSLHRCRTLGLRSTAGEKKSGGPRKRREEKTKQEPQEEMKRGNGEQREEVEHR